MFVELGKMLVCGVVDVLFDVFGGEVLVFVGFVG